MNYSKQTQSNPILPPLRLAEICVNLWFDFLQVLVMTILEQKHWCFLMHFDVSLMYLWSASESLWMRSDYN
jgi:hypothetical protein